MQSHFGYIQIVDVSNLKDTNRPLDNFHQNYHTLEEIHRFMDALAEQFPTMVKLETLGKTYKGSATPYPFSFFPP